jgi:hypothetical protein
LDGTCDGCATRISSSILFADSVRKADSVGREQARLQAAARRSAYEDELRRAAVHADSVGREAARLGESLDAQAEKQQRAENAKAEERRAANIRAKHWPDAITKAVIARRIRFGMSHEQVRLSWGEPDDIHRTVIPGLVSEQWIYGSQYVYFTNGAVSGWQD